MAMNDVIAIYSPKVNTFWNILVCNVVVGVGVVDIDVVNVNVENETDALDDDVKYEIKHESLYEWSYKCKSNAIVK